MSDELATTSGVLPRWFPIPGIRFELPEGADLSGGGWGGDTDYPYTPLEGELEGDPAGVSATADDEIPEEPGAAGTEEELTPAVALTPEMLQDPAIRAEIEGLSAQTLLQALEGLAEDLPQEPEPLPMVDPLADDWQDQMAARDEALITRLQGEFQAQLQPLLAFVDSARTEKGTAVATDTLDKLQVELGGTAEKPAFDPEYAHRLAQTFIPQNWQQLRPEQAYEAGQQALRQAATLTRDLVARERSAAVKEYVEQMQGIRDTPAEPGVGAAAVTFEKKGGSYDDIISRHASRVRATSG